MRWAANRVFAALSGGERQRVLVARGLGLTTVAALHETLEDTVTAQAEIFPAPAPPVTISLTFSAGSAEYVYGMGSTPPPLA